MRLKSQITSASTQNAVLVLATVAGVMLGAGPAFADAYRLDYKVSHSKYGNVGTYTNTIDTEGSNTTVSTNLNIQVRFIGISAYHQTAQRVEKWQGDRLVYLHALTTTNGKPVEVNGVAQGDRFQVTTPRGVEDAPANVRVANPWSPKLMNGDTIVAPDDGEISKIQVTPAQDTMVEVGGEQVAAKKYEIDFVGSNKRYQVWFDGSETPVEFAMIDHGATVTFALSSKTPVSPAMASNQPESEGAATGALPEGPP